jgi:hypothetical protein
MRPIAQYCLTALAGALIAWVMTAFVLHAIFVAGGYKSYAVLPVWSLLVIGGVGAAVAMLLVRQNSGSPLPAWVRPAVIGGLIGVVAVVIPTVIIARERGGPTSKGQARYLHAGLIYGLPVGAIAGMCGGLLSRRKTQ